MHANSFPQFSSKSHIYSKMVKAKIFFSVCLRKRNMGFWESELSANGTTGGRKCRTVNKILDYGWYIINLGYKINGLVGGFKLRKCLRLVKSELGLNSEILFKNLKFWEKVTFSGLAIMVSSGLSYYIVIFEWFVGFFWGFILLLFFSEEEYNDCMGPSQMKLV